jgi:hypothetical protein
MDQSHVRSTKRALRQNRRELSIDPDLSANNSTEELNTALLMVKSGKTAGFDGVYPEFIKNSGKRIDRRPFKRYFDVGFRNYKLLR